ncbi:MAG: Gp15 family bacteriophage protein [Peptostreptococcaceae bacterium]
MFNILVDLLPTTIEVGGIDYPINTDFRTSILFEQMMVDTDIDDKYKGSLALDYYFGEDNPAINENNEVEFMKKALGFYNHKKDIDKEIENIENDEVQEESSNNAKIYDYDYDDIYIYSAFLQQYGIDLQDIEYLHWWKFKAMFNSLKEDCKFCKILEYRGVDLSKIQDNDRRAFYKKMKDMYRLPDKATLEEEKKNADITKMLMDGIVPPEELLNS